jgi:MFS family permease
MRGGAMNRRASWLPVLPGAAWRLLGGECLSALGSGLTLPFLLVYLHDVRGLDLAVAGLAMACLAAAGFVANPLGGALSDRAGARATIVVGLLSAAAGAVALTAVRESWQAFAATAVLGLGVGVALPAQEALLARLVDRERLSAAFSLRHMTLNVGLGAGSVVGALVVDVSAPASFQLLFVLQAAGIAAFAAIVLGLPAPPAPVPRAERSRAGYRIVLRDRQLRRLLPLATLLFAAGYSQYGTAFPAFAVGNGGIEASALGAAFAANTFTVVAAQLLTLRAVAKLPRSRALALVGCTWALAWAIVLAAAGIGGGPVAVGGFCLAMAIFGLGETLLAPTLAPMVNELATDDLRGRYNGACAFACTSGWVLGPAISSALLGTGLGGVLIAGLLVACALAALWALRLDAAPPEPRIGRAPARAVATA